MAQVNKVSLPVKMNREQIIRFQLLVYTHLNDIHISSADFDCLTLLGLMGEAELIVFCAELVDKGIFTSVQSSRNALSRLQDKHLIAKQGRNKKKIFLPVDMKIQCKGNILLEYKCLALDDTLKG